MLKNTLKISLVTPSFNQGRFIEQTITSVLDQNYPNLEYIIIDGGSTDNTVEIIKKYEKYITYWVSEPDKGQTDAINKGFKRCTGDIFNWINSDDYYAANALNIVADSFSGNERTKVVCGKEYGFYDDEPGKIILHKGSIIHPTVEETIFTGIIDQPCTFFRREAIEPFFPLNGGLNYVMDRQLWWCFLAKYGIGDIKQIDDILTNFRIHSSSKSTKEGDKFDAEFALLKLELLHKLAAPVWLIDDILPQIEAEAYHLNFFNGTELKAVNANILLSVFAYDFALRSYVKDDLYNAHRAIKYVRRSGGLKKEHVSLFLKVGVLPPSILKQVKQLKKTLFWKN